MCVYSGIHSDHVCLVMRIPSKPICFHVVLQLCLLLFCWFLLGNLLFSVVFCAVDLWNSCENLVGFYGDSCENLGNSCVYSCENLVYARGLLWGNTGRQCPQEIAFGIPEVTGGGCPRTLAPQRFPDITSDNHTLSERITCSLLKPQVFICACTVESIVNWYV